MDIWQAGGGMTHLAHKHPHLPNNPTPATSADSLKGASAPLERPPPPPGAYEACVGKRLHRWRKRCCPRKDAFLSSRLLLALPSPTPKCKQTPALFRASRLVRFGQRGQEEGGDPGGGGLGDERERDSSVHTESSAMGGVAKELDVAASEGVVGMAQVM